MARACLSEVPGELCRKSIKWECGQDSRQITIFWASSSTPWNGHEHWWVDQNFRMLLRDKRRAGNFPSSHTHEVSFMAGEGFLVHTWERKIKALPMPMYVLGKTVYQCYYEAAEKWDAALSCVDQLLFCVSQLLLLISVKYFSSCSVYSC